VKASSPEQYATAFLLMPFDNRLEWLRTLIVQAGDAVRVRVERADDQEVGQQP